MSLGLASRIIEEPHNWLVSCNLEDCFWDYFWSRNLFLLVFMQWFCCCFNNYSWKRVVESCVVLQKYNALFFIKCELFWWLFSYFFFFFSSSFLKWMSWTTLRIQDETLKLVLYKRIEGNNVYWRDFIFVWTIIFKAVPFSFFNHFFSKMLYFHPFRLSKFPPFLSRDWTQQCCRLVWVVPYNYFLILFLS